MLRQRTPRPIPVIYTIRADSVKITNDCDTAELIIENHTQHVPGFLFNKGRGRTEFRKVTKLNDSSLIFGDDTLSLRGGTSANNGLSMSASQVQLGQPVGAAGNPAALLENREIPSNGKQLNLSRTGSFVIGPLSGSTAKLQVNGTASENYFAAGPLLSNQIYATIHTIDTVTAAKNASTKLRALQVQRRLRIQDDGLTLSDKRSTLLGNVIEAKNNVSLNSDHRTNFTGGNAASVLAITPNYNLNLAVSNAMIIRGIFYNPFLTSIPAGSKHIAIETRTGDVLLGTTSGNVGIGVSKIKSRFLSETGIVSTNM